MPTGIPVTFPAAREAAQHLRVFTIVELADHMGINRVTAWHRVNELIAEGMVRSYGKRRGRGRPADLFQFIKPQLRDPHSKRRKEEAPERQLAGVRSRGSVVIGTGADRISRRDVKDLLRDAQLAGADVVKGKKHYRVERNGRILTTVPTTPSDYRSLLNTRATLRRKGLAV